MGYLRYGQLSEKKLLHRELCYFGVEDKDFLTEPLFG